MNTNINSVYIMDVKYYTGFRNNRKEIRVPFRLRRLSERCGRTGTVPDRGRAQVRGPSGAGAGLCPLL